MGLIDRNEVLLSGEIVSEIIFNHIAYGCKFYKMQILARRRSGAEDIIPVILPERILKKEFLCKGMYLEVKGSYRSTNTVKDNKRKLILYLYAKTINTDPDSIKYCGDNMIDISGTVCTIPRYKQTSKGKDVVEFLLQSEGPQKFNRIPCICWFQNSEKMKTIEKGTHIVLNGRIQSRDYLKDNEIKTTYEVAVKKIEVMK